MEENSSLTVPAHSFAFEEVEAPESLPAPQAPGTNALVHNPFAWAEED